jgi:hypothetical protein
MASRDPSAHQKVFAHLDRHATHGGDATNDRTAFMFSAPKCTKPGSLAGLFGFVPKWNVISETGPT